MLQFFESAVYILFLHITSIAHRRIGTNKTLLIRKYDVKKCIYKRLNGAEDIIAEYAHCQRDDCDVAIPVVTKIIKTTDTPKTRSTMTNLSVFKVTGQLPV